MPPSPKTYKGLKWFSQGAANGTTEHEIAVPQQSARVAATATVVPDALSCLSKKEAEALYTITKKLHNRGLELLLQMQPDPYSEPLFW